MKERTLTIIKTRKQMKRKSVYEAPKIERILLLSKLSMLTGSEEKKQLQNYQNGGTLWDDDDDE